MFKKILCPIDGSEASNAGKKTAIELALTLNAELCFIHIIDTYYPLLSMSGEYALVDLTNPLRQYGEKVLNDAKKQAAKSNLEVETKLVKTMRSRAAEYIIRESKKSKADLIVMGTRGLRGMKRVILGSDAEFVVQSSAVPVMLVNSTEVTKKSRKKIKK